MPKPNLLIRSWMEKSVIMGAIFKVAGVFGVALLLAGKLMVTIPGQKVNVTEATWVRWHSHSGSITARSYSRVSKPLGQLSYAKVDVI